MTAELKIAFDNLRSNSPYLSALADEYPDINPKLLSPDPSALLAAELSALRHTPDDVPDGIDAAWLMAHLRRHKRRLHLIIAVYDLAQIWSWVEVTRALTVLADICVGMALNLAAREGGFSPSLAGGAAPGLFVLAVGKYGGHELNYSSDIDIIVFYDPDVVVLPQSRRPEMALIRLVQKMVKILDEINGDGYVFRTDLRLRPDPRSNAFAVSTRSAERYYESLGQNWERAAMIKARVCAGDKAIGQDFIDSTLRAFIWRRSLDFAAIADIQAMKRQINAAGGHSDIIAAGHHLKLGRGGIREIEFYAQTQQLILGGRHKGLRCTRTDEALLALAEHGFISPDRARSLIKDYGFLRGLEHCVQMIDDAQTHIAPKDDMERLALARLSGFKSLEGFDVALCTALRRVHDSYISLYPSADSLASPQGNLSFTGVEAGPNTLATLERLGYARGPQVWRLMADWLGGRIAPTRSARARESLTRLAPHLISICSETGLADTAFFRFADFFTQLNAGVSLLALFERQPAVLAMAIDIMAQAPRLAGELARQPATMDALIEPDFYRPEAESFIAPPAPSGEDLEMAMNRVRRHIRESHFKVSANILAGKLSASEAGLILSNLADYAAEDLLRAARRDVERRKPYPGGEIAVIALGKMGGREMRVTSDLDIMVVYDPGDSDPLLLHPYYTKLTQRLVSALSAPTQEGDLYEVDMALRPSGGAGPITVSLKAFENYYENEAWTWEFMAMTRARIVSASSQAMQEKIEGLIAVNLGRARDKDSVRKDVADMRTRLERDKGARGEWDIKRIAGGLVDIEFIAQYLQLIHGAQHPQILSQTTLPVLKKCLALNLLSQEDFNTLKIAANIYSAASQYIGISTDGVFDETAAPDIVKIRLAKLCGFDSFLDLKESYQASRIAVRAVFKKHLA
ncbi:MAG: bifunctional [glutamine synthetase] adenylyltransferase/[glutamine synthetase]-adenylyl-L-tyrosine phosphorylase [Robiginitomaculum sp.]